MDNRHQGEQQIEIGSGPLAVALDGTAGPWQGSHHAAKAIKRDQPSKLNRQRKWMAQGGGQGLEGGSLLMAAHLPSKALKPSG